MPGRSPGEIPKEFRGPGGTESVPGFALHPVVPAADPRRRIFAGEQGRRSGFGRGPTGAFFQGVRAAAREIVFPGSGSPRVNARTNGCAVPAAAATTPGI